MIGQVASDGKSVIAAAPLFADLLRRRLAADVFTTEDSVRYTFFAALLDTGCKPEDVVLEYPHPVIANARVDTVLLSEVRRPQIAIEFKYDRENRNGNVQPRPQKAGSVFADLVRLLAFVGVERFLIYLTDNELAGYWANSRNGLSEIFHLATGQALYLPVGHFADRPATFHKSMGDWSTPARLESIMSTTLPRNHHLKVYRIAAIVPAVSTP